MYPKKKLRSSLFLTALTFAFLFSLYLIQKNSPEEKFARFSDSYLQSAYENDSLSLHFTLTDPSAFGIDPAVCSLPCYDRKTYLAEGENLQKLRRTLSGISPAHLPAHTKETYEILTAYLEKKQEGTNFPYFEEPLSPTSGIHTSLPVLLAEYSMEEEKDVKSYLALLSLIPSYFDSLAAYETDKAAAGMFMASEDASMVISQCDFMASEKGEALFTDCFLQNLKLVYEKDTEKYAYYASDHARILHTLVQPAYEKLGDSLLLLKEEGKEQRGLCQYKNGKAYYTYLVQQQIGCDLTTEELAKQLSERLQTLYAELAAYRQKYPIDTLSDLSAASAKLPAPDTYLSTLQDQMSALFPPLPASSPVTVKEIPTALAPYTAPAYYFTPRLSLCRPGGISNVNNVIYVNPETDYLTMYTTLAHEGFPGHMFQNVYFLASQGVTRENILRYVMNFPGYSEGWAMYVELLSFDHAYEKEEQKAYAHMLRLSREIQICLLCYLDIRIHAESACLPDIAPYLAKIGITEPQELANVYTYLINEPGTYLKYYGGYLQLLACKELYQKKCGKEQIPYSDLAFHTFFLSHGPDSYTRLSSIIQSR